MSDVYDLHSGTTPLLISIPHAGTDVPPDIAARFSEEAKPLADTDWHVDTLYDFAADMGASVIVAKYSRYVIDLNRPPDDESLYPGQTTTGLVPVDTFEGEPVYQNDIDPDLSEVMARVEAYWRPYHTALAQELERIKSIHGHAILWDAHSIASQVPRLFEGTLSDFNLGTNSGKSCSSSLAEALWQTAQGFEDYSSVIDARFKGGQITRSYGNPANGIQAIQLELSQATYMDEHPPWPFQTDIADKVRPCIRSLLQTCLDWKGPAATA